MKRIALGLVLLLGTTEAYAAGSSSLVNSEQATNSRVAIATEYLVSAAPVAPPVDNRARCAALRAQWANDMNFIENYQGMCATLAQQCALIAENIPGFDNGVLQQLCQAHYAEHPCNDDDVEAFRRVQDALREAQQLGCPI